MKHWKGSIILLRLLFLIHGPSLVSCAGSTSYWTKTQNGLGLLRDLVLRVGHQNENKRQGLQLISGGFPRTGTKSIEAVLTTLGYRVYDSRAMLAHPHHFDAWTEAAREWQDHHNLEPLHQMTLEIERLGYSATLDIPMNLLAPALIHVRPDAKVLWNYRASGVDDWYESFCFINQLAEPLFYARPWKWIFPNPSAKMHQLVATITPVVKEGLSYPDHLERPVPWYERLKNNQHPLETNAHLKRQWTELYQDFPRILRDTVRQVRGNNSTSIDHQYLEYTVQEGWAPLLQFLEVDDPHELAQQAFPHVNDRSTLIMIQKVMTFIGWTFPLWVLLCWYLLFAVVRGFVVRFRMPDTQKSSVKRKQE